MSKHSSSYSSIVLFPLAAVGILLLGSSLLVVVDAAPTLPGIIGVFCL
jgi:hypothetical protein